MPSTRRRRRLCVRRGHDLGGDDGIAVAYALAVLDAKDIPHPALEVVLTVCEEVGLLVHLHGFSDLEGGFW